MIKVSILFVLLWPFNLARASAICAVIAEDTKVTLTEVKEIRSLKTGESYKVIGRNRDGSRLKIQINNESAFIGSSLVQLNKETDCQAKNRTQPKAIAQWPSHREKPIAKSPWRLGVELGYGMALSGDGYSGLITKVPDPTNVGALQDPVITNIKDGSGYMLRGFMEKDLSSSLVSQLGFGYRQQTFKYEAKKNPTTAAVRLDQLSSFEQNIESQIIELGAGVSYLWTFLNWQLGLGGHLDLLYNLSGKKKIDVLVPTDLMINKNTAAQVQGGPDDLVYELKVKVDARLRNSRITLGVTQDAGVWLSLGYLWD